MRKRYDTGINFSQEIKCIDFVSQPEQVLAVGGPEEELPPGDQLVPVDEALEVGDLVQAGDLKPLPVLDRAHEFGGLQQAVVRAGVEPRIAPAHSLDVEVAALEIGLVDVGDLQLAPGRGLHRGGDVSTAL